MSRIVTMIILLWVFLYTISYGKWEWQKKNRLAGAMVVIIALAALVLPVYLLFFRE